ncbi:MAG: hypothetical protein HKL96_05550 [Phycisphaerales bacterium]|nr:hypothetical protein [Phycisphaerales bacterium]
MNNSSSSQDARGVDPLPPDSPARRQWPFKQPVLARVGFYAMLAAALTLLVLSAPAIAGVGFLIMLIRLEEQQRSLRQRVDYLMRQQVASQPNPAAAALQESAAGAVDPQPWLTALEHTPPATPPQNDAEPPVA